MTDLEQRHLADHLLAASAQLLIIENPEDGLAESMANWSDADRVEAARAFARHLPIRLQRKCLAAFASPQVTAGTRARCIRWSVLEPVDRIMVAGFARGCGLPVDDIEEGTVHG